MERVSPESSVYRNGGTFIGGLIFGRFFNTPIALTPNLFFGGDFDVYFKGKVNGQNSYAYVYIYTDHQGNVRLSYSDTSGDNIVTNK
jgi:hypothetical protein